MGQDFDIVRDKLEIAEHTALYNQCWDDNATEDWVNTWTEQGVFRLPGAPDTVGKSALRTMIETMKIVGFVHLTMNPRITVDRDHATQTCAVLLGRREATRKPGTSQWVTTGRYHDQLVRTPSGWRFDEREFIPDASLKGLPSWW